MEDPIVTVFRSHLREGDHSAYEDTARATEAIARGVDGFVEFKTFTADDGERLSLIVFSSEQAQAAWREHADHRRAQHMGRSRFYRSYDILVCRLITRHRFEHDAVDSEPFDS